LKNLYAHNILFRKAKKNINNYGLFVVRYFYVLWSVPKLQTSSKSESADTEELKKKNSIENGLK
jgi:hypothetical protein